MADFRVELDKMSRKLVQLQRHTERLEKKLRANGGVAAYQSMLVKAEEDIKPDETGTCVAMYRLTEGSSPYLKLKPRKILKFKVYNHRDIPINEGDEFHIVRDNWNHYYKISDRGLATAFFLTGDGGLPAASGQFNPQSAECERHWFNEPAGVIEPLENVETGNKIFEWVYNHTTNAVAADKLIQAKRIDGAWFIDVEPC